jgi:hypothetical protein
MNPGRIQVRFGRIGPPLWLVTARAGGRRARAPGGDALH